MTTIKANCPMCGPVDLRPAQISLRISLATEHEGEYSFLCPTCKVQQTKPANERICEQLIGGGVLPRYIAAPTPAPSPGGPPIDIEDLRDFVRELNALPTADAA